MICELVEKWQERRLFKTKESGARDFAGFFEM